MGTIVTAESFELWRLEFMKEVAIKQEAALAAAQAAKKGKLTGLLTFSLISADFSNEFSCLLIFFRKTAF